MQIQEISGNQPGSFRPAAWQPVHRSQSAVEPDDSGHALKRKLERIEMIKQQLEGLTPRGLVIDQLA